MGKLNCWEIKNCGRITGGNLAHDMGVCPVYTETKLNGINGGKNAGRACWTIAGTMCGGKMQGSFAMKQGRCMDCETYKQIQMEEGSNVKSSMEILDVLRR